MFKAWWWFVAHSSGQSVCWKNRESSTLFNIWTRNKTYSPSDDIFGVPDCAAMFCCSLWDKHMESLLVMVCSPVKLSTSASLRNRVVIPGKFCQIWKKSKRRVSLGFSFHFLGVFYNFVMYLPQNSILKCHIVLNPPKLGNRTQFCA